jgi:hypothetical protein
LNPEFFRSDDRITEAIKTYFDSTAHLFASDLLIQATSAVREDNPIAGIEDVFRVESLTDSVFKMVRYEVVYRFEDGTTEVMAYGPDGERPAPSDTLQRLRLAWFVFLPGLALVIMTGIVVQGYRHRRKLQTDFHYV